MSHVAVAWIGQDDVAVELTGVCRQLERTFLTDVSLARLRDRPTDAFDARRGQYESTRILRWLERRVPPGARSVLAVTDQDLCIVVLTYVFGEAQVGGPAAVVSTARLQTEPAGAALFHARHVKECVHEVGHTFGLTHCRTRGCVMGRANTIHDVDAKGDVLCRECHAMLAARQMKESVHVP